MNTIRWEEFEKVLICAGTVLRVEVNEAARKPSYKLWVDFGSHGIKASSAQLRDLYSVEDLVGRQVLGVLNFEPKRIAGFLSECLITGFADEKGSVVIATTDSSVPNGSRLF